MKHTKGEWKYRNGLIEANRRVIASVNLGMNAKDIEEHVPMNNL